MYTDKELLKLAGKLALTCSLVLSSQSLNLSGRLQLMQDALEQYDNAIIQATEERKIK